eukprot:m.85696 g.85696  ORF g.85696 m.85696 type:complete len:54 (+) comp14435_c1_seq2:356-517(+)
MVWSARSPASNGHTSKSVLPFHGRIKPEKLHVKATSRQHNLVASDSTLGVIDG